MSDDRDDGGRGVVVFGALVAVIVHEREMTTRALVVGLVRCVEARR